MAPLERKFSKETEESRVFLPALVGLIRLYQRCISPLLGPRCRFYPTCSEYAVLALKKHGCRRGIFKSAKRLCKCHPFHPGGVDLP